VSEAAPLKIYRHLANLPQAASSANDGFLFGEEVFEEVQK